MWLAARTSDGRVQGERLLRQCLTFARGAGYRTCYLETLAGMEQAQKLYRRLGFRCRKTLYKAVDTSPSFQPEARLSL